MLHLPGLQGALTITQTQTSAAVGADGEDLVVDGHHQRLVARAPIYAGLGHFLQKVRLEERENRPFGDIQDHDDTGVEREKLKSR